jgi:hypothetical protein
MQSAYEQNEAASSGSTNGGHALIIVLFAAMIGSILGVMIATQDVLPGLNEKMTHLIPAEAGTLLNDLKAKISGILNHGAEEPKIPEDSEAISTGIASVEAIHYSSEADSAQIFFDLVDLELINTGKLSSPDRVYVDFQNFRWKQDPFKGIKTLKALEIGGDLVSRIRIKKRESGVMRIVLDLTQCCDFTYSIHQQSPFRLIVHLQPV